MYRRARWAFNGVDNDAHRLRNHIGLAFLFLSRDPRPAGSQPPFRAGRCSIPIRSTADRHSLPPASLTPSSTGRPHGRPSTALWKRWGLPRSARVPFPEGLGSASAPVAQRLRGVKFEHSCLATCLLAQAFQPLWLVEYYDACSGSLTLAIPSNPSSRPPQGWQSQRHLAVRLPAFTGRGYIVPGAPHPGVAPSARPGRVAVAEHHIILDKYSCDFVSHRIVAQAAIGS